MRIAPLIALAFTVPFCSCAGDQHAEAPAIKQLPEQPIQEHQRPTMAGQKEVFVIVQRTCALYVAVRSAALEVPIAFGRDLDETPIHWNMCPGDSMVACVPAPTVNGDTTWTGIPWPY